MPETKIYVLKHEILKEPKYFRQLKHVADFTGISYTKLQKRFYKKGMYEDDDFNITLASFEDGTSKLLDFLHK